MDNTTGTGRDSKQTNYLELLRLGSYEEPWSFTYCTAHKWKMCVSLKRMRRNDYCCRIKKYKISRSSYLYQVGKDEFNKLKMCLLKRLGERSLTESFFFPLFRVTCKNEFHESKQRYSRRRYGISQCNHSVRYLLIPFSAQKHYPFFLSLSPLLRRRQFPFSYHSYSLYICID